MIFIQRLILVQPVPVYRDKERRCGPDGFIDSVRYKHNYSATKKNKHVEPRQLHFLSFHFTSFFFFIFLHFYSIFSIYPFLSFSFQFFSFSYHFIRLHFISILSFFLISFLINSFLSQVVSWVLSLYLIQLNYPIILQR